MKKLKPENQILVTRETVAQILGLYSISDFTFEPIHEGIENTSLIIDSSGKKNVLRIYAQEKNDEDIACEIRFQDYLRENAVPIPIIYPNTEGNELTTIEIDDKRWHVILMEFIEGQSVTPNASSELIRELAQFQVKMHLLGMEFAKKAKVSKNPWSDIYGSSKHLWLDFHDSLAQKIQNSSLDRKDIREFIERVKKYSYLLNQKLPYGCNHLDLGFYGNILTKHNRINGIIDFDDLEYSPLVVCLGFTLWGILNHEGVDAMRHYLQEYEKLRPLTPIEKETLQHAVFFRNYAVGVIRILLWDENTSTSYIENTLKLEKDIPALFQNV